MVLISESPVRGTEIQKFYAHKNILVTGGTGFIGGVLIEKLLRTCEDINNIYVIIRCKKGKDMNTRLGEIFQSPVFSVLKETFPKFQHKVQGIEGDCSLPGLGLSASDRQLLISEISVVFHVAATVRFDEKYRLATQINAKATQDLLQLAKEMKNLKAFVHISTAYTHCERNLIDEQFYKCPVEFETVENLLKTTNDKQLENMKEKILYGFPNTYTLTKALAEDIVANHSHLPVGIVRPAIVVSTFMEPIKGWIDNVYGPTGICVGAGTGVLRTLRVDPDCAANIVPVDLCVNSIICCAWKVSQVHEQFAHNKLTKTEKNVPILNYVSNVDNPITWRKFMYMCEKEGMKYPSSKAIWYYNFTLNKHWLLHWLYTIFLHIIPALFVDGALLCVGKSPQLIRTYIKIINFTETIKYFTLRSFNFQNNQIKQLWSELDKDDRELFPFDIKLLNWDDYFDGYMKGIRLYLLKESCENLPESLKRWKRLYWLHQITKFVFTVLFFKIVWNFFKMYI